MSHGGSEQQAHRSTHPGSTAPSPCTTFATDPDSTGSSSCRSIRRDSARAQVTEASLDVLIPAASHRSQTKVVQLGGGLSLAYRPSESGHTRVIPQDGRAWSRRATRHLASRGDRCGNSRQPWSGLSTSPGAARPGRSRSRSSHWVHEVVGVPNPEPVDARVAADLNNQPAGSVDVARCGSEPQAVLALAMGASKMRHHGDDVLTNLEAHVYVLEVRRSIEELD
jgi:hypothetical protein